MFEALQLQLNALLVRLIHFQDLAAEVQLEQCEVQQLLGQLRNSEQQP
jgi:hypothetical protein